MKLHHNPSDPNIKDTMVTYFIKLIIKDLLIFLV